MQFLAIIGLSVFAAVTYGILHDQITARICVEYFTIGHVRLIASESPTLLALIWGVVATWWVGLPLGIGLAASARFGSHPKLTASELIKPLRTLLVVMFVFAFLSGVVGLVTSEAGLIRLIEPYASQVPQPKHTAFLVCGWAHTASYFVGLVGGLALCGFTWRRRSRLKV